MGGIRPAQFTTTVTCEPRREKGAPRPRRISGTSFALHPITVVPVYHSISPQAVGNMSAVEIERAVLGTRRRILTGLSMPKSKACRKLVFEPSSDQNDREEDAAEDSSTENFRQEHLQRQSQRWGFNFEAGEPLADGRLEWVAESEETVPHFYREVCLRSPPRRNLRVRRNIMSARTSESTEHHHRGNNGHFAVGEVNASRVTPANNLPVVPFVSVRSETETASVAVSTSSVPRQHEETLKDNTHGCNSVENHNNGILQSSRPSTSSKARMTQSHIGDFFNHRKRRSSSESKESSAKRTKSFQDHMDRPRSAPAAVATSS